MDNTEKNEKQDEEINIDPNARGTVKFIKKDKKLIVIFKEHKLYHKAFESNEDRDEFANKIQKGMKNKCKKLKIKIKSS